MEQAVEEGDRSRLHGQEVTPLLERPVARHAQAAACAPWLATSVIERSKPQLVDQDQLMPQEVANDLADRVLSFRGRRLRAP